MRDVEILRARAGALTGAAEEATAIREADEARAKELARRRAEVGAAREVIAAAAREVVEGAPEESRRAVTQIASAIIARVDAREQEATASLRILAGRIDAMRELEGRLTASASIASSNADETEELVRIASETGVVPKTKEDGRPRRIGNVRRAEAQIKDGSEKA